MCFCWSVCLWHQYLFELLVYVCLNHENLCHKTKNEKNRLLLKFCNSPTNMCTVSIRARMWWYETHDMRPPSGQYFGRLSCLTAFSSSDLLSQPCNNAATSLPVSNSVWFKSICIATRGPVLRVSAKCSVLVSRVWNQWLDICEQLLSLATLYNFFQQNLCFLYIS